MSHLRTGHGPPLDMRKAAQDRAFRRLPLSLRSVLLWMTERDPRRRPGDIGIVRMVLEQALHSLRMRNPWVNWLKSIPVLFRNIVAEATAPTLPPLQSSAP